MSERRRSFCQAFLRTMDAEQAAAESGRRDGYRALGSGAVRTALDEMRTSAAEQVRREDVIRRLAQLAFGRANDAVRLALAPDAVVAEKLELSAVAEFKVTEKGVEVKLVDRVRALETLWGLLEERGGGAEELCRALEEAAGRMGDHWDDE